MIKQSRRSNVRLIPAAHVSVCLRKGDKTSAKNIKSIKYDTITVNQLKVHADWSDLWVPPTTTLLLSTGVVVIALKIQKLTFKSRIYF